MWDGTQVSFFCTSGKGSKSYFETHLMSPSPSCLGCSKVILSLPWVAQGPFCSEFLIGIMKTCIQPKPFQTAPRVLLDPKKRSVSRQNWLDFHGLVATAAGETSDSVRLGVRNFGRGLLGFSKVYPTDAGVGFWLEHVKRL